MKTTRLPLVCLFAWAITHAALCAPPGGDTETAIRARINRAQQARTAAQAQLSPAEQDLLWLLNFEQPGVMLARDDGWIPVNLETRHYSPGKFGQGYYFEVHQFNYLPPAIADVETDLSGFSALPHAKIASVVADTNFGKRALSVTCTGAGDGFATVPVKMNLLRPEAGHMATVSLVASCYLRGPQGAKVRLLLQLAPAELLDPRTQEPVTDRKPDVAEPQEITLTGEWQRIACTATGDRRLPVRLVSLGLALASEGAARLLVDGFQFESCGYYPHFRTQPTTWTPGGTSVPGTGLVFTSPPLLRAFPRHSGTVAFWTLTPPSDCNLKGPGAIDWFAFWRGWDQRQWTLNTYNIAAGQPVNAEGQPVPVYSGGPLSPATDGQWHHLAMTWAGNTARVYRDGKQVIGFTRADSDLDDLVDTYALGLGRGREQFANSVLDDYALFRRALTAEEIAQIATGAAELRAGGQPVALAAGPRAVFYRDEATAQFEVPIVAGALRDGALTVDAAVADFTTSTRQVPLKDGRAGATVNLAPAKLKPGEYIVRVAVSKADGTPAAYREFPVQVVPALRRDCFFMSTWGGGLSAAELRYYQELGLNGMNTGAADPATLDRLGAMGFAFDWHYRGDAEPARLGAQRIAMMPSWWRMLINSETGAGGIPDEDTRKAWFDAYVLKSFGAPIPAEGWKFGSPNNYTMCMFPADQKPRPDGIYSKIPETFRFLQWWEEGGGSAWQMNFRAAQAAKAIRPDVLTWTDAVQSRGQYSGLDAGGSWSYSTDHATIWNELQAAYAIMRTTGKPFESTLGLNYVSVESTDAEGKKKNMAPTADDAIGQAWVATGLVPAEALYYWDANGYLEGERQQNNRYAEPGSTQALGRALKEDLGPLGTMLSGVGNSQRPMALLLPQSTLWFVAGEGGWNWGVAHYPNMWKMMLANSGLPYDILCDYDVTPGNLAKYKVIFFPMGMYVHDKVYQELLAAAQAGTRIVVDSYCKQTYPGMTALKTKYEYWWSMTPEKQDEYFAEIRALFAELRESLRPGLPAYAEGSEGPVLVNSRETNGVKYVVVVNNNRQAGPYTELAKRPNWKPYGKAQSATVSLAAPAGSAVYEFVTSQRLPATVENGRLVVKVDLPAAGGRVLCVYPSALGKLMIEGGPLFTRGTAGALQLTLTDAAGKPTVARQLANVQITGPGGQVHDESGWYRLENGKATVPFRPALNDAAGEYQVTVTERTSGLKAELKLAVK